MDLITYLKVGLRWWWLILLSVALSATASYVYSQRLPRLYAARTTLVVGNSIIESLNPQEGALQISTTLAEVYGEMARRNPVTEAVVEKLGLNMDPDELSGMIQTNVIPSVQLLEIIVMDVHPQRAELLANSVARELILQSPAGSAEKEEREKFIHSQLSDLQAKIQDTDRKINELTDKMNSLTSAVEIAEADAQLIVLEDLKTGYQATYNQFLSNLAESSPNRLAVLEPATEPTFPVSPNVKKNVAIAGAAGFVLALTVIILLEFFDDTIAWRGPGTQSIHGVPILGSIRKIDTGTTKIVAYDTQNAWAPNMEAFRALRSSIFLSSEGQRLSTLLVTSPSEAEGKSFVSANLAVTIGSPASTVASIIAASGSRVILLDADLRKPSLHEMFDLPNLFGLTDVLAAPEVAIKKMLEKGLRQTQTDGLLLLTAGRTPVDPGFLLNSTRFTKVLQYLRSQADLIIIDSAPILEIVETKAVANMVDGVLLVVADGQSRGNVLQEAIHYFRSKENDNLLGVVLNRVKSTVGYSYYSSHTGQRQLQQPKRAKQQPALLDKVWPFARSQSAETNMLSLAEAASHLGVSEEVTHRWCEQGRLKAVKNGRRWLIPLEDLNEFMEVYQHVDTGQHEQWSSGSGVGNDNDSGYGNGSSHGKDYFEIS